ncbi:2-oxoacid:acceptor oxidoreductase delta subunit (pyruvate/2-ketoisovalerate family) [Amycolatopsis lexingtonensis]|uniref:2-oxoacid:acceptor oxidoreductase delta subunit (Pyruvate/2-ketoisovalerate family) n=1 Tax=Amycolatopsis lexingtonensis TaxID=218822 RepID=A0ABR9HXS6_9PSEU|nr:NAD(P)-binding protein [Amycolatopsis lexingtonensis]MBE1495733.1 2-oxoacid:acceptor oxidoreductase delta subunit (pyruvate/2-ketoisovalerate family) [Amycolatopsis lexingtonensis]
MEHEKPFAITLDVGSSRANKTGAWRSERPVYVDLLPPCNQACPSGQDIQKWLYHAESGDYEDAWRGIMTDNPLPAVLGRICYRPCESACNRGQLDEAVGINSVERFLGDEGIKRHWKMPVAAPTGRKVLVVGAGPAGLSAAYHLARLGHAVTVRDAEAAPGGMMRYGIPRYRLPREVIDAEIRRIADMGVTFEQNSRVTDVVAAKADGGFDAVFLAVGAQVGKRAYIPAGDSARVLDAISVLHDLEAGERPLLGRRVAVYGGGNTAMDAARTAKRLGATDAVVVYRRTRDRMPAHESEVTEAAEEGVSMRWLSTISEIDGEGITIEKMRLDDTGFPQPTGEFERLAADSVVLALGQDADLSLVDALPDVEREHGVVRVGPGMMTGHAGIFAGGDMVPSGRTATVAVGHGAKAARQIDAWLRDAVDPEAPARREATFDDLNTWYYSDADRKVRPHLDLSRRVSTFDEIKGGLNESTALFEARRCLSCGNCFECDNCYGVCPDNAVLKLEPGEKYAIDLDYCKGCGICVAECPCGAIEMVPEET